MKKMSLQWRLTCITTLCIAIICGCLTMFVYKNGVYYIDSLQKAVNAQGDDSADNSGNDSEEIYISIPEDKWDEFANDFSVQVYNNKEDYRKNSLIISALLAILGGVATYFISGHALKPLREFSDKIEEVQVQNLADSRIEESKIKELNQLKDFVARNKARVSTRNMAMSRQKKLDKMDVIELAAEKPKPEFHFRYGKTPGKFLFETHDLVTGYDEPLSKPLNLSMERGQKIALVGTNGIGKTTLLKSILGLIPSLSGTCELGENLEIGYFEQEVKGENRTTCIEEIWQEFPSFSQYEVRSALAKCGLTTKHIESQVRVLSGGEQAKVRLCKLINRDTNILLLDEPTNHLDVDAKDSLKKALQEYRGSILLICHEPEFYQDVVNEVWDMSKWTTKVF